MAIKASLMFPASLAVASTLLFRDGLASAHRGPDPARLTVRPGQASHGSYRSKSHFKGEAKSKLTYKRHHRGTNGALSVGVSWQNVVYNPTTSEEYVYWL
jgi:hypothetical protein